jgi:hypothetical protein
MWSAGSRIDELSFPWLYVVSHVDVALADVILFLVSLWFSMLVRFIVCFNDQFNL